ncbi:MAG: GlsB/YeaQ/YmgE family stress response membrane protein [Acidimicrobiales bacterium]
MIGFIIWMLLLGLIAGFIARAVVPGNDSMSVGATIVLGIIGSFVGGFLADLLFRSEGEDMGLAPAGIIGSIIGAIIALLVYNAATGRKRGLVR